jgi:hypothetical protein
LGKIIEENNAVQKTFIDRKSDEARKISAEYSENRDRPLLRRRPLHHDVTTDAGNLSAEQRARMANCYGTMANRCAA